MQYKYIGFYLFIFSKININVKKVLVLIAILIDEGTGHFMNGYTHMSLACLKLS